MGIMQVTSSVLKAALNMQHQYLLWRDATRLFHDKVGRWHGPHLTLPLIEKEGQSDADNRPEACKNSYSCAWVVWVLTKNAPETGMTAQSAADMHTKVAAFTVGWTHSSL